MGLLDVRVLERFEECHILTAQNFPLSCLHQDRMNAELYRYKSKNDKIIVVYDEEEKIASEAATLFLQKGFENVRLLTGGLKIIGNKFPEYMQQKRSPSPKKSTRRSSKGSYDGASVYGSGSSVISTSMQSTMSHRSTFSRAPRWNKDKDDIQRHR